MCGIVGYIGKREAYPILIKGLKRLEYRGYDSAGVALINDNGGLCVYKTKGKVADLEAFCADKDSSGVVGIAHTRWATHGEPSSTNAHPHFSQSRRLAIIHNGIIENYADIKKKLVSKGVKFCSDTDTEVLVQLVEYVQITKKVDLLTAVQLSLRQVIGAYAIALLDKEDPGQIIAARKQSPLVVGIGDNEFFLGSDASPIVEYTDKVVGMYDQMSRYDTEEGIVICYGTMYGNTERMAEIIAREASQAGIKNVMMYNVSKTHHSYLIRDVFRYKGLIVGAPTYNTGLYHEMEVFLSEIANRDIKNHLLGWFGSYGWAGKAVAKIAEWNEKHIHFEAVGEPVEMKQALTPEVVEKCRALGRAMAERLIKER